MGMILLCILTLALYSTIDGSQVDPNLESWIPREPWYPRQNPRRPPPPLPSDNILRPYRPYPPRPPQAWTTTTNPPIAVPTTKDSALVLYKIQCDPCIPGWGVKSLCNSTSHTICMPCAPGTWTPRNPHYRPCIPCSKCGPGLFEEIQCTSTKDTKCNSCTNPSAKINDDFVKKCGFREDVFDVRVSEWKLNDDTRSDASPEFDSNEDGDLDALFTNDEDPRMIPDVKREDVPLEVPISDIHDIQDPDEKKEWDRIMGLQHEASEEIAEISDRLQYEQMEAHDEEEQEVQRPATIPPRRPFLRPLPQSMPIPGPEPEEPENRVSIDDDIVRPEIPAANNYPPSYHGYPIDSLVHAGEGQRRKAIVLLILVSAIVLSTIAFMVCYVRELCRRRSANYNRVLVVNLSPEEREIIRQSAQVLETLENPTKKQRFTPNGYSQMINTELQTSVAITENPLEAYLNNVDERKLQKEPLIENEVANVHRQRTSDA